MPSVLPLDCLVLIGRRLQSLNDLASFIRVNRSVHSLLRRDLYRRDNHIGETLEWAASVGRKATFQQAIDAGVEIAEHPEFLRILAGLGQSDILDWLLTDNAKLRGCVNDDPLGYGPPLFAAINSASIKTVYTLIEKGADVNHLYGRTPLGEALGCVRDTPEILHALLENGANVSQIGDAGYSPLLIASEEISIPAEVLSLFLEFGADVNSIAELDMSITPLHAACRRGNLPAVRLLLAKGALPNAVCEYGLVPLHFATQKGYAAIVRELLSHGADPNVESDVGWRALCLAIKCRSRAATVMLLLFGANPHKTYSHESPLTLAIESGDLDLVQMILEAGVDITELEHHDVQTALGHTNINILRTLWDMLSGRAFVEAADRAQRYVVAAGGDYDVMMMDYQGDVAFYGRENFVSLLLAEDTKPRSEGWLSPLHAAAWAGHVSTVKVLLKRGANIRARTNYGMTAVMGAAIEGHVEVVRVLLAFGANVSATDTGGNSALHYAAMNGRVLVLKLLMELRGNLHQRNRHGFSVVDCSWNQPAVIKLLMNVPEADLGAVGKSGCSLLTRAASAGLSEVIDALFEESESLFDSETTLPAINPSPRLIGNVVDHRGTLPVFAAIHSRDWETLWRFLVVQDDILLKKDFAGKTVVVRVLEAGDESLTQQLLMYAMKNRQEAAWECSPRIESTMSGLCDICTHYLPTYLPPRLGVAWTRWDADYFLGPPRKLVCHVSKGIHSWDAVTASTLVHRVQSDHCKTTKCT
ncbi:Ankyrin repeat-containing domain protein [Akanthomyces lecanii RCEF 1005]|uniref:Ankyrin repeat-containing domain protein n=1 Tax=Akanthomyces lecanii RCEF 1005 TaxID=1081108 RepID=A0A162MQ77_CORDF|nr:Ankyrin repeat-containing domain protein [Akanthomyces lecanii RCEF 1005]